MSTPPVHSGRHILGFFLLAAALYWLAVLLHILGYSEVAVALSFLLVLLGMGAGTFGWF